MAAALPKFDLSRSVVYSIFHRVRAIAWEFSVLGQMPILHNRNDVARIDSITHKT
jgi:hypothetical protein